MVSAFREPAFIHSFFGEVFSRHFRSKHVFVIKSMRKNRLAKGGTIRTAAHALTDKKNKSRRQDICLISPCEYVNAWI